MPLYPGKMVLYRWRLGEVRAGQTEAAAMITMLHPDGSADLTVYPAMDREPRFQRKVPQMSAEHDFHCWRLTPDDERMEELEHRVAELEAVVADLSPPSIGDPLLVAEEMSGTHPAMIGIQADDTKRRRGRARKVDGPSY